jgi:hypothetical protein
MSRIVGGVVYILGLLAAVIAVWNVNFDSAPISQIVIGIVGLILAFLFVVTLQENPNIQRAGVFGMIALEIIMIAPTVWRAFAGVAITQLQIALALVGVMLLFVNWRMLPR